jgi:hypothetical protein
LEVHGNNGKSVDLPEGRKALYLYVVFSEEEEKPIDFRINCRRIKRIFKINLSLFLLFSKFVVVLGAALFV